MLYRHDPRRRCVSAQKNRIRVRAATMVSCWLFARLLYQAQSLSSDPTSATIERAVADLQIAAVFVATVWAILTFASRLTGFQFLQKLRRYSHSRGGHRCICN